MFIYHKQPRKDSESAWGLRVVNTRCQHTLAPRLTNEQSQGNKSFTLHSRLPQAIILFLEMQRPVSLCQRSLETSQSSPSFCLHVHSYPAQPTSHPNCLLSKGQRQRLPQVSLMPEGVDEEAGRKPGPDQESGSSK